MGCFVPVESNILKGKSHLEEDDRVFAGVLHEKALEVVGTGSQNLDSKDNHFRADNWEIL